MHVLAGSFMMSRVGLAGSPPMARSTQTGRGRIAGWIGSVSTVTLIVFIASNSRVSRADRSNEASAIGSLRAINSAQAAFASSCAAGGYVTDLADLNKKPGGSRQGFISPDLNHNDVVKSGYIVRVARDAASSVTEVSSAACVELTSRLVSSYFASAVPVKPGETGTLFFATDTRGTIYRSRMGPIPNPIPADAEPLQPAR
jgi:hypothetical protein